ncbi:MAG TPA: M48 family metallopeptidase [Thermomicrobiales bacterium]|nr:M48 family metallopeptidase [Thermomicrobiales bacterium]
MDHSDPLAGLDVRRARRYRRISIALYGVGLAFSVGQAAWLALSGRSARLRSWSERRVPRKSLATPAYLLSSQALDWLTSLPLSFAGGYTVERYFGLTTRTPGSWLAEQVKSAIVATAFQVPLGTAAFSVIRRRPADWWLLLSAGSLPLAVLGTRLGPVVIAPLFNRFDRVDDADLVERITELGERAGVRIADVYRMDMSHQTEKANAYFTGTGRSKRIVLGDTLLDRFDIAEIEAVVAHELGHQVHGDLWRLIALYSGFGFLTAFGLHRAMPILIRCGRGRSGVRSAGDVAALPLFTLALTMIGLILQPVEAAINRRIERRTDAFAVNLTGDGEAYARAMARLALQNLDDPDPPRWLVWLLYGHPPTAERIAMARATSDERSAVSM